MATPSAGSTFTDGTSGNTTAYAARDKSGVLSLFKFNRPEPGPNDIEFNVEFCGICHSDLHQIKDEWGGSTFPMVPGHELVGKVTRVGSAVKDIKPGQSVGVGCMVGACNTCAQCNKGLEQFCKGSKFTYNAKWEDGTSCFGGYSTKMVVDRKFLFVIPENLPLDRAAPLLCAGVTTYAPMVDHKLNQPGMKIGVVGLGGLGHMAVKFAVAFGCEVTVISTSEKKREEAIKGLGAHKFLVSTDKDAMKAAAGTLDGILDTVSAKHDVMPLLDLLGVSGKLVMLGVPPEMLAFHAAALVMQQKVLTGSLIGGTPITQQMLNFCGEKNVMADIEVIKMQDVNTAFDRMLKSDVRYRFVIDMATLKDL